MKIKIKNFFKTLYLYYVVIFKSKSRFKVPLYRRIKYNLLGFSNDQIVLYDLKNNDYKDYINEIERWKSREVNGKYKEILDNKLLFTNYFKELISIPKILFYTVDGMLFDIDGSIVDFKQFEIKIRSYNKLILKPNGAGGGSGVYKIEYIDNNVFINGNKTTIENLYNLVLSLNHYITNEYINQHNYASEIYPDSTNTIRIITLFSNGKSVIHSATHRFGSDESRYVDNISSGGYFSNISLEDGSLGYLRSYASLESYAIHPSTSVKVKGKIIPMWEEIKELVLDVSSKVPYIPYMSWDIVITNKNKIKVIEINASTGLTFLQMEKGLRDSELDLFLKSKM